MTIMKRRKLKFIYGLFLLSFIMTGLYYGTKAQVSRPELCTLCHMMKPEYYSWKASSHEKVSCIICHQPQNKQSFVTSAKRLFFAVSGTYSDPIKALSPINDKICENCHKLNRRNVTASGDVIIPHDVHKREKVLCIRCHGNITHGDISDRRVTYRSDYVKWDSSFGKELMTEEFYRPKMDLCMRCHKSRAAPLECRACHRTQMLPDSHKAKDFQNGDHGRLALNQLKDCDSCHGYMSKAQYTDFEEENALAKYFSDNLSSPGKVGVNTRINQYKAASSYAKTNEYCQECHRVKPPSHNDSFFNSHGKRAKASKDPCFVCHDDKLSNFSNVKVVCSNCHPSAHYKNFSWKNYHPIKFKPNQKIESRCYDCHTADVCAKCHKGSDKDIVPIVKSSDLFNKQRLLRRRQNAG